MPDPSPAKRALGITASGHEVVLDDSLPLGTGPVPLHPADCAEENCGCHDDDYDDELCPQCCEDFCTCPDPEMVAHHLEKALRVCLAREYCDDPAINELLDTAIPLIERAWELNEARLRR